MTPAELAALHALCFETPRPWSETEFAALLSAREIFLTESADGFALGRLLLDECELLTLAVAPDRRRRGSGRRLMVGFETHARDGGAERIFLEVAATNAPAIALYENCGYQCSGRRRDYYRSPTGARADALIYTRSLA